MIVKEKRCLDNDENGLYLENIDEDGVNIVEKDGGMKVYVYYSEFDMLIEKLQYFRREYYNK